MVRVVVVLTIGGSGHTATERDFMPAVFLIGQNFRLEFLIGGKPLVEIICRHLES